mgnify:CR=1 FL=1
MCVVLLPPCCCLGERRDQYSYSVADVIGPDNLRPKNDTWHFPLDDVVYWGMDWLCPAYNQVRVCCSRCWHVKVGVLSLFSPVAFCFFFIFFFLSFFLCWVVGVWTVFVVPFVLGLVLSYGFVVLSCRVCLQCVLLSPTAV